jgi:hypothetical protein
MNENWTMYWSQGEAYLKTARGSQSRTAPFRPTIVHNLGALAIEGFFLGALGNRGQLPNHHTFGHFAQATERLAVFPTELKEGLRKVDRLQNLCTLEISHKPEPSVFDALECLDLAERVRDFLENLPETE